MTAIEKMIKPARRKFVADRCVCIECGGAGTITENFNIPGGELGLIHPCHMCRGEGELEVDFSQVINAQPVPVY